ncbi:ABC transporter permease [Oceanobacillus jeddahense]|uniref:ABC transporter permease n=1 Tax=Oceanobacillus jeddahense TaxID=1462527 RepID=A0ABY5JXC3_9BACI|nr:ABC transporter permease [Oceanobacillus jeddahense]UUI04444.1 ABC transporter permease [Oceanobacillus jeddahense]
MEFITKLVTYMIDNSGHLLALSIEHLLMVGYGIGLALIVGIPLGIIAAKFEKLAPIIIALSNVLQLIPSLAMLAILMLYFGFGFNTIVIGLFLYSLLPIVKNTYVGIKEVDESIIESGIGSGMTTMQLLRKIQFPLSIPFLLAGIRLAAVIAISVAAIGPYIGAGGLGSEIVSGISLQNDVMIYAGAIPATLIAIVADFILGKIENKTKKRLI